MAAVYPKLYIVDAMAMIYRSFHAFQSAHLSDSSGRPTGAIYGVALFLNRVISELAPDLLIFALEGGGKTWRHQIYHDYKGHRDKVPGELESQMPIIMKLIKTFGPVYAVEGIEADDLIGSIVSKMPNQIQCHIISPDKDFYQLISDHVHIQHPKPKQPFLHIGIKEFIQRFSFPPCYMVDYLSLVGDPVDNIPGVKGIGDVSARRLILQFGTIESIYENISQVSNNKMKEHLIKGKDQAILSKKLVTIRSNISIPFDMEDIISNPVDSTDLIPRWKIFEKLQFNSLLPPTYKRKELQIHNLPQSINIGYEKHQIHQFIDHLEGKHVTIHCGGPNQSTITLRSPTGQFIEWIVVPGNSSWKAMTHLLQDHRIVKVGHHLKKIFHILYNYEDLLMSNYYDIMIADYLIDPNSHQHTLEHCWKKSTGTDLPSTDKPDILCFFISKLYEIYRKKLDEMNLSDVLKKIELPLIPILTKMEKNGVFVDRKYLLSYGISVDRSLTKLEDEIKTIADSDFNINSTKQLQRVLFEKLRIQDQFHYKNLKKTKTGYSTDESVLKKFIKHPICFKILEYRSLMKLKSTYINALPKYINQKTKKIHSHFNQTVAATGRLSSDRPNLQNIPSKTQIGQEIRRAFRPQKKEWIYLSADYSQIELRLLAYLSNNKILKNAFSQDKDVHKITAAKIFCVDFNEVTPIQRERAKTINFGIIYGMGAKRLSEILEITISQARDFIKLYFDAYPGIKNYQEEVLQFAKNNGFITTEMGRRRPIIGLNDRNRFIANRAVNIAINSPLQGLAADIIKVAMINTDRELREQQIDARIIMQIHDELILECPLEEVTNISSLVKHSMESVLKCQPSLKVNINVGESWYHLS